MSCLPNRLGAAALLAAALLLPAPAVRADWRDIPYADVVKMPMKLAKIDPGKVFTARLGAEPGKGHSALPADFILPQGVTRLSAALGQPHSESVWLLGQEAARLSQYTDLRHMLPIYARPPEAVELWNLRHGT